jgi:hypothetical protein
VAYGRVASRQGWPLSLLAGSAAFTVVGVVLQGLALGPGLLLALGVGTLVAALRLTPSAGIAPPPVRPPRGDLPARMVVATVIVLALTALAPRLGARLSGLLATYPLFAAILAAFAQRLQGPAAAAGVLRGLLFGLFSFAAFCFVLGVGLVPLGIGGAFAAAIALALLVQGLSLGLLTRGRRIL